MHRGDLCIVYNGEIYNFVELREDLKEFEFETSSDTEVLLHAYQKWGPSCVCRLNGMFAFAIWNKKEETLFCARDQFGIKPFHYCSVGGQFLFSSEIKPLLLVGIEPRPDFSAIYDYLVLGLLDHSDRTFFAGIHNLLPGHTLTIKDGYVKTQRYWKWETAGSRSIEGNPEQNVNEFRDLLKDSIKIRFRSDVPVGICLSGGLDSTAILCISRKDLGMKMHAFSALFKGYDVDEAKFVALAAESAGADIHPCYPTPDDLSVQMEDFLLTQEEPVSDPSVFAQWSVMREAHRFGMKVLLDGQGADEILGGYAVFFGADMLDHFLRFRFSRFVEEYLEVKHTQPYGSRFLMTTAFFPFLHPRIRNWLIRISGTSFIFKDFMKHKNVNFCPNPFRGLLRRYMYEKFAMGLPALLHYEDRNSMRWSIEARLPYLDPRLVQRAFLLPENQLLEKGVTKVILRRAVDGVVPAEIINRRVKIGFDVPDKEWFGKELLAFAEDVFDSESFSERGIFDVDGIRKLLREHVAGSSNNSKVIWRCLNLELWLRTFIDRIVESLQLLIRNHAIDSGSDPT
jgi:asparagine synthase (glutamine-hydrolysing)